MSLPLQTTGRWLLGAVFVIAGAMKVAHPAGFFADLLGYRVPVPEMALRGVAAGLPWLEVLVGAGLLLNVWPETIRPLTALLCLVFIVLLAQAVLRGLDLNCGCFGTGAHGWFERPDMALARATVLFVVSVYVGFRDVRKPGD